MIREPFTYSLSIPYYTADYGDIDENELESYFEGIYEDELTKNTNKSPLTESDITYDPENDIYPWGYNKTTSKLVSDNNLIHC